MSRIQRTIALGVVTATLAAGGVFSGGISALGAETLAKATSHLTKVYDDNEVVTFLVFGQGPIAVDHKALAEKIRATAVSMPLSLTTVEPLTKALMSTDPDFHVVVTEGVQAHDPYAAQAALERLDRDLKSLAPAVDAGLARGAVSTNTSIVTQTTVAVAAVLVGAVLGVAVAVAGPVILYKFDRPKSDRLSRSAIAADLTRAL